MFIIVQTREQNRKVTWRQPMIKVPGSLIILD